MGLLKKKTKEKEKPEEIAGLLADTVLAERKNAPDSTGGNAPISDNSPPSIIQGSPSLPAEAKAEPQKEKKIDSLSSLDIFAAETAETQDEVKLSQKLPEVDINDLLRECREIAAIFKQDTPSAS